MKRPVPTLVRAVATACLALLWVSLPAPGSAQESRTVQGLAVQPDGSPAGGVPMSIQVHDGNAIVHQDAALADERGSVVFEGVPVGAGHRVRIGALFAEVTYYSEPVTLESPGDALVVRVPVAPVSSEGRPLHLDTLHLIIQAEAPTLYRVLQFVTVSNAGEVAWAGGPALPDGRPSGLTIPLPRGARDVQPAPFPSAAEALQADSITIASDRVLDGRPVPPTGRQAAVTYLLSAESEPARVSLPLPYPTQTVSVLLGGPAAADLVFDATNLSPRPAEQIGEDRYELWTAEALAPGSEVTFRIGPPNAPLLPAYGWALAGLGLALLVAAAAPVLARPAGRDERLQQEILTAIARLDVAWERDEIEPAAYHRERGRALEKLLLIERRAGDAPEGEAGGGR